MSIVPIYRREANVQPRDRLAEPDRAAPPDRVPILMRMPDLARIDGPQATLEMHAPPRQAGAPRPPQTTRPSAHARREATSRPSQSPPPYKDTDRTDSQISPIRSAKVRARGNQRRPARRREVSSTPPAAGAAAWLNPTNLMVGAAVLAVIISIIAMVRRPTAQSNDSSAPAWNAGGNGPPAVNPVPAAPLGPTAIVQPRQREQDAIATPSSDQAFLRSEAPRQRSEGWSDNAQEPVKAESTTPSPTGQLPLPEPEPEPGQWPARSAMQPPRQASLPPKMPQPGGRENSEPPRAETAGTATLTGAIDKPEQPTTLRAEHERIGQGVY